MKEILFGAKITCPKQNYCILLFNKMKQEPQILFRISLVKVKQSHYRPWGFQVVEASISRQSAHKCRKDVSPTHRLPLPHRKYISLVST